MDNRAKDFSLAFYDMLMHQRAVGGALQNLRAENPDDPTFQAFA